MRPSRAGGTNAGRAPAFQRSGIAAPPRYESVGDDSSTPPFAVPVISAMTQPKGPGGRKRTAPIAAGDAAAAGIRTMRIDGPPRTFIVSLPDNTPPDFPSARGPLAQYFRSEIRSLAGHIESKKKDLCRICPIKHSRQDRRASHPCAHKFEFFRNPSNTGSKNSISQAVFQPKGAAIHELPYVSLHAVRSEFPM